MKRLLLPFLLVSALIPCDRTQAQTAFEAPNNPVLNTREDYAKYEGDIIKAAKWLEETDLDKETDKRVQIDRFLLKWVGGSPTVNISIDESVMRVVDNNPPLLSIYIASYSRSVLQNKGTPNNFLAVKSGVLSVLKVYKKGIGVTRNRQLEKLARMEDSEIDEYILGMLNVNKA